MEASRRPQSMKRTNLPGTRQFLAGGPMRHPPTMTNKMSRRLVLAVVLVTQKCQELQSEERTKVVFPK